MNCKKNRTKFQFIIVGVINSIEHEWPTLRFIFWSISIFAIIIASQFLILEEKANGDFLFQNILFTGFALVGAVVGGVIGYGLYEKSTLWVIADLVWIMLVLISLWRMLAPVESYFNETNLATMRINEQGKGELMLRKVWQLEDIFCGAPKAVYDECNMLKLIEREVGLPSYKPNKNFGVVAENLAKLHILQPASDDIRNLLKLWEAHIEQYDSNASGRVDSGKFNLWFPYLQTFILTLALSFRVGRTGAEYRKKQEDKK